MTFQNKVALVTGGDSGIGRATAIAFAQAGARVVIGTICDQQAEETVAEIRSRGGIAVVQHTDVTQAEQVRALVQRCVDEFGRLDVAFNNAGVPGTVGMVHEQNVEAARHTFEVNFWGVFYGIQYEAAQMLANGGGAIVNTASVLGLNAAKTFSPYIASKHAVVGLTKTAALDYARNNIRVNAVAPGPINTAMLTEATKGDPSRFERAVPMRRVGQPEEVSRAVLWLCSDSASYVTGHTLPVEGGQCAAV